MDLIAIKLKDNPHNTTALQYLLAQSSLLWCFSALYCGAKAQQRTDNQSFVVALGRSLL